MTTNTICGIFRGSEDEWLSSTGKTPDGNIHIPIDRAMDILASSGLPQVSGPFQPANVGAPRRCLSNRRRRFGTDCAQHHAGAIKK